MHELLIVLVTKGLSHVCREAGFPLYRLSRTVSFVPRVQGSWGFDQDNLKELKVCPTCAGKLVKLESEYSIAYGRSDALYVNTKSESDRLKKIDEIATAAINQLESEE